jgi:5-formyltetrahydrofolate cyclo-ligase
MKREKLSGLVVAKEEIRKKMRATLRGLTLEFRAEASLEICRLGAALSSFREAKVVGFFAALPTEPDIRPLIEEAWAHGKRLVFPLMLREGESPRLEWHQVTCWEEMIVAGPFGIREPDPVCCPRVAGEEIGCLFVPGLAFDARGGRLGRGGGYYDSALAGKQPETAAVGLMFACQEMQEVPRESHDQTLGNILTEKGIFKRATR